MTTVMGVGLIACGILVVVNRLLRLLFWSRVRTVNPALWAARRQSWGGWANVIGPRRFAMTRVIFSTWKHDWEPEFGSLADNQLERLAGLARGFFFGMAGLWACLFAVALVYEVWTKF